MSFQARLTEDLKSSAPKTVILAVTTAIGLYFWIPPLWRMVAGSDGSDVSTPGAESIVDGKGAKETDSKGETATVAQTSRLTWEKAKSIRERDLLFQGAKPHEMRHDAFTLRNEFLPILVDFAVDPPDSKPVVAGAGVDAEKAAQVGPVSGDETKQPSEIGPGLTLQSTLVGVRGRRALINGRIYSVGDEITVNERVWTLNEVWTRTAMLTGDGETIQLRIAPFEMKQAQLKR